METLRERTIGEGREASQQQQRLAPPPEAFPITEYSQIQSQLQSQSSQPANSPFTSNPFGDENTVAVRPTSLPRAGSLPPPPPPPTTLFNDLAHALAPHRSDTHADDHPLRERDDDDADTDSLLAPPPEYQEHHQATSSSFVATGVEVEAVPPSYDAAGLPAGSRLEVGGALAAAEKEQSGLQGDQGSGLVPLLQGRVLGTTSEIGTTDEKADLKKAEERERTFPLLHQQQHADYEPLHHPQNRTSNPHAMPHHHHQQQQHHHQQQQDKKENDTEDEEKNHLTDLYSIADALSRAYTSSPRLEAQRYIRSWPSSSRQESSRKESSAYASSVGQLSGGKGEGEGEGGSVRASGDAAAAGSLSLSDTASLIVHSATATATAGHIGGGDKGKEKERERASESSFGSGSEVVMLAGGRMTREDEAELRMIWDQIERAHGYRLGEQSHTTDPTNEAERRGRQKEAFYRELLRKTGEGRFRSQDHSPVPVGSSGTGTSNRVYDQTRGSDESLALLNAPAAPSTSATVVPAATASASAIEWHQSFARIHTPESQRSSPGIYNMLRTDGRDSGETAAPNLLPSGERRPSEEEMLSMQDFLEKEETLVTMQEFLRKGM